MEMILHTAALLILASLVCIGIHIITSGRWEKQPDGTKYYTGKLLNFVSKFFDQHRIEVVYLQNALDIVAKIDSNEKFRCYEDEGFMIVLKQDQRFQTLEKRRAFELKLEKEFDVKVSSEELDDRYEFRFYFEKKIYKFSDYIKDPLYGCPSCMASFWGGGVIYTTSQLVGFVDYGSTVYNILFVIPFMLALVTINNLNKKLNG